MSTFIKITNEQIYNKLEGIDRKLICVMRRTSVNKWIATTALSLCVLVLMALIAYIA